MNLHENSMTGGASPTLPTILHDATNRPPSSSLAMFKVRHVSSSAAGCRENSGLCAGVGSICLHPYYIYGIFIIQSWVSNILILYTYTYTYTYIYISFSSTWCFDPKDASAIQGYDTCEFVFTTSLCLWLHLGSPVRVQCLQASYLFEALALRTLAHLDDWCHL